MSDDPRSPDLPASELSQAEAIALLRQSIQQLDQVLVEITRPAAPLPSPKTLKRLADTASSLSQALALPETRNDPTEPLPQSEPISNKIDRVLPDLDQLDNGWDRFLDRLRSWLPGRLGESLSDWAITGILAAILVVTLVSSVLLLPKSASEIAQQLPEVLQPSASPFSPPVAASESLPPEPLPNPPELIAPNPPEPIAIEPPPAPKFTPEQSLLAAIQQEIADLTQSYSSGLIRSVEANFIASRLGVTVGSDWYELTPSRQEQVGNEVWRRSQALDFRRLDLIDPQGFIVARNPVVGDNIVILQRSKSDGL